MNYQLDYLFVENAYIIIMVLVISVDVYLLQKLPGDHQIVQKATGLMQKQNNMAITRKQLIENYGFRASKDHKKLLTRKVGGEDTIDVFGNVMFYEGKSICTLEWMPLELFSAYLEKLISSIKKKQYAGKV